MIRVCQAGSEAFLQNVMPAEETLLGDFLVSKHVVG